MPDFTESNNPEEINLNRDPHPASMWIDLLINDFTDILDPKNFSVKFNGLREACTDLQERITSDFSLHVDDNVIEICNSKIKIIEDKYKDFLESLGSLAKELADIEESIRPSLSLDDTAHLARSFDSSNIPLFKKYAEVLDTVIDFYATDQELNENQMNAIAHVATDFEESQDPVLVKQASVLDELLLTLSAPKDYISNYKKAEQDEIDKLIAKNRAASSEKVYKDVKKSLDEQNKVADTAKQVDKMKQYRPLEASLSTRYCPEHPGFPVQFIGNNMSKCSVDGKVYNWTTGFDTMKGNKVPGGGVEYQTPDYGATQDGQMMFDTRDSLMVRAADAYLDILEKNS